MIDVVGQCAINPVSNFHINPKVMPAPTGSRKVLVVGGGVAGMQAAITAADRGHHVTLAEKSTALGGILNFTDDDVYKTDLRRFKEVLIREVEAKGIDGPARHRGDSAVPRGLRCPTPSSSPSGRRPSCPPSPAWSARSTR